MRRKYDYWMPRPKAELLKAILPTWQGSKTELRQYSIQRLRAIYHTVRLAQMINLMKKVEVRDDFERGIKA